MNYYLRSDGPTFKPTHAYRSTRYLVERWNGSKWVTSRLTPPELQGLGGSTDFFEATSAEVEKFIGSEFSADVSIVKRDNPKHRVFGWANTSLSDDGTMLEDLQGHMIPIEDLEEGAYRFTTKRYGSGDMHTSEGFGTLIESAIVTADKVEAGVFPAEHLGKWWIGFQLPPDEWQKVKDGKRTMFSIQGKGKLTPVDDEEIEKHADHDQSSHGNWARTGVADLDQVIEDFLNEPYVEWPDQKICDLSPEDVHGACQEIAEQFADFAEKRGFQAYATQTDLEELGYEITGDPHGEVLDEENNIVQGHYNEHTVTSIYMPQEKGIPIMYVVDFAAMQYGYDEHPRVFLW